MIISDQGPDLNSVLFNELCALMGMRHSFSIANRHVNGVERELKEVMRHLRAMVYAQRVTDVFEDPTMVPSAQYIINSLISSETSLSPFEITFGTQSLIYEELLKNHDLEPTHLLLKRLNENLATLRAASKDYQDQLVKKRAAKGPTEHTQNRYQPGDYVTFDAGPKPNPKLSTRLKGPYRVEHQTKNDVHCRHLITDAITQYSVTDLEPFFGTKEQAFEAALRDQEQFVVLEVLSYSGNCKRRTQMSFTLRFSDGDIVERAWSPDIQCEAYHKFCISKPYLYHLSLDTTLADQFIHDIRKRDITNVSVGDTVFVDLRFFSDDWYEQLGLPDWRTSSYVVEFVYTKWYHKNQSKKKISATFTLANHSFGMDTYCVYCWGSHKIFDATTMILVDKAMIASFPRIVEV